MITVYGSSRIAGQPLASILPPRSSVFLLPEPVFVQIQQIPDSAERNDDKLYFFFREKSLDSSGGASPSVLARVGRVCLVSPTTTRGVPFTMKKRTALVEP